MVCQAPRPYMNEQLTDTIIHPSFRKIFTLVQKSHLKSANIARLEAAVKAYGALTRIDSLRAGVLKKLTGMLLHPFPRVRPTSVES